MYPLRNSILTLVIPLFVSQIQAKNQTDNLNITKIHQEKKIAFATPDIRCPKGQPWTDVHLAQWLHISITKLKELKIARSLDNHAICTLPSSKLARAFSKIENPPRPDKPDEAMKFRTQQLSVYGKVKPDGLINAIKQRDRILSNSPFFRRKNPTSITSSSLAVPKYPSITISLSKYDWRELGPGNIGGRIRTIYIHPKDSNLLFAGSVGGGIWKSTDGGNSWNAVNDFMANLAITSIVADPRTTDNVNTTVLYASTGEGFYNIDGLRGYGLFKSTDGGETWQQMVSTDPTTEDSDWYYVNRIAINNSGVIIAATRDNAIFTSTDDGASWSKSAPGDNYYTMMEDVKFDPNDDTKAIVGSVNGNCYYSTDSGNTWIQVNIVDASSSFLTGRVELAYAASENTTLFASVDNNYGEIYKSLDGGISWSLIANPQHLGNQGWYDNTIWVDPTNADHLVIGGLDLHRTTDGGENWTKISRWQIAPNSPHADHHAIVSSPNFDSQNNLTVYIANDGGLYKTDDINTTNDSDTNNGWTNINNGIAVTQFYGAAALSGSRITGGTQDNGTLLNTDFLHTQWSTIAGGDGGYSAVSNQADTGKYYYFGEYVYLMIHRSDDGSGSSYIYENGLDDAEVNANFIAPFVMDPNNNNVMLAGGASLWRSSNVSDADETNIAWNSIKDALSNTRVSQIAIAEGDSDLILVGYNNGLIYKTTNGTSATPTWTQIHDENGKNVLSLMIDKDNHEIFYAGWGGFDAGNLQQSTDSGSTWSDISAGLPEAPMRTITRHPSRSDYLYVGTEVGIFTSEDQGKTWFTSNNGPANVSVEKLFWYDDETIIAATHGRGIFRAKVELNPCEEVQRTLNAYKWTIVSFPCDTGSNGVEALLGTSLGTYGNSNDWVMYEQTGADDYIGSSTQKRMLDANDTVEPAKGYWIITATDRNMTIDHTLSGLAFTPERNASDFNIADEDFSIVHLRQLPDSDNDNSKKIMLGNPFPRPIELNDVYFSHDNESDGYNPMNDSNDSDENPNAPYIEGTVYTFGTSDTNSNDYIAVTPDTPGFADRIDPMTGFFIKLKSGTTGSNYMTFPYEK